MKGVEVVVKVLLCAAVVSVVRAGCGYCTGGEDCCLKAEQCMASFEIGSTEGCELYPACPPTFDEINGQCFKQDPTAGSLFSGNFTSLEDCLAEPGLYNEASNYCLLPYREAVRECLKTLGRRG
mmetsp:Transcript_25718/g.72056  ORF Transcript_25718/g.72056 Transcript_25718/m.72056 type:complete len:124 (+) Transcript_25718:58-429(+)